VRSAEFHPELRRAARFIPRHVVVPSTVPLLKRLTRRLGRRAKDVDLLTLSSGIGVRVYRPAHATEARPALLWIHGGGYVIGGPGQDDLVCRHFARTLGITVAAVQYRLAPQHPYPAGLEDCYDGLKWLATAPTVYPARVAIGGASAGGGLAAALALLARDRGEVPLAAQLLVYPMLDDRTVHREGLDNPRHRLWTQYSNQFGWASYLGDADPDIAVPARRTDLSGLPPAWVGVGSLDLFHDEDLAYAERLKAAGVPCDVEVVEGAFHGFDRILPKAKVSRSFLKSQCDFLRQALARTAAR
jgi:acetyl esterase/lipase